MLALAHLKFVIARGWCQSGFFQIGFQSLNPLINSSFCQYIIVFSIRVCLFMKLDCKCIFYFG